MKKLKHLVRGSIEGTLLSSIYRTVRDEWQFRHQHPAETPWGFKLAGPREMQAGTFEPDETLILRKHLSSTDLFVDVGANVGYFTCLALGMGKYSVAVEPLPGNLRYLYHNLHANGWMEGVEIYPVGLADRCGLAAIYGAETSASLVSGWAGISPKFQQKIPLSTLDVLLGDRFSGKRMVIKVDVEGAEHALLKGARHTLRIIPRPVWMVEITLSEHRQGGRNPFFLETFEAFWELGYRCQSIGSAGRELSRQDIEEYAAGAKNAAEPDWLSENYVFLDREE